MLHQLLLGVGGGGWGKEARRRHNPSDGVGCKFKDFIVGLLFFGVFFDLFNILY
jgi:hypothetical protein